VAAIVHDHRPSLLVLELWGLGDLALSVPFLREVSRKYRVSVLAKPGAGILLRRFAPETDLIPFDFPWTAFRGKYRLWSWPWASAWSCIRHLRGLRFDIGVSVRPDPRDHTLLLAAGCKRRLGFPRLGSGLLLNTSLPKPVGEHRAGYWAALGQELGCPVPEPVLRSNPLGQPRHFVIHTGAGHPARQWPVERWNKIAVRLEQQGWKVTRLDDSLRDLDKLISILESAERFAGNDSGPGHLAALLGVPTFTLFGPQLPERFAPVHAHAAWVAGAPCRFKPCKDSCHFDAPRCLLSLDTDRVWTGMKEWLR
jgi:heptosyltransferase-2